MHGVAVPFRRAKRHAVSLIFVVTPAVVVAVYLVPLRQANHGAFLPVSSGEYWYLAEARRVQATYSTVCNEERIHQVVACAKPKSALDKGGCHACFLDWPLQSYGRARPGGVMNVAEYVHAARVICKMGVDMLSSLRYCSCFLLLVSSEGEGH
jgi:hypothetical protein